MYQIKTTPEDFIVEEVQDKKWLKKGEFQIIKVIKKNNNTEYVAQKIARIARVKRTQVKYAGTKDKIGITTQYMSIKSKNKIKIKEENLTVTSEGFYDEPLSMGNLKGNNFSITVRNLKEGIKNNKQKIFPNFYDKQRFGTNNAEIGYAIIKKEFSKACELLKEEKTVKEFLQEKPKDFCGAIRTIPKKILIFYIHAYQSKLFNQILKDKLKTKKIEKLRKEIIPLIGFGTESTDIVEKILQKEKITTRDFIIREIPELSSEGTIRDAAVEVQDLKILPVEDDELNKGKKKQIIQFFLQKGSYATNIIKYLYEEE